MPIPHPLAFLAHHPLVATTVTGAALLTHQAVKWTEGRARVRYIAAHEAGRILVEMDDDKAFIADPVLGPSLRAAQENQAPVHYKINNFARFYGMPCGNIAPAP